MYNWKNKKSVRQKLQRHFRGISDHNVVVTAYSMLSCYCLHSDSVNTAPEGSEAKTVMSLNREHPKHSALTQPEWNSRDEQHSLLLNKDLFFSLTQ